MAVAGGTEPVIHLDTGHQRHANGLKSKLFRKAGTFGKPIPRVCPDPSEINADIGGNRSPRRRGGAKRDHSGNQQRRAGPHSADSRSAIVKQNYILALVRGETSRSETRA